jgi:hypothetical protein
MGTTGIDTLVYTQLKWLPQPDGILYDIQYSQDSTFSATTYTGNTGNLYFYIPAGLPSNTKYFWRVRTNNGGYFSAYSQPWHFTTSAPLSDIGLKKNSEKKTQVVIFPNPGSGIFNLTGIEKGNVVEVRDVNGKLIYQSIAKDNSMSIDMSRNALGIYDLLIKTNGNTVSKKLIVEK